LLHNPWLGWALAVAAVAAGYVGYGWKGVVLAVTAIVFWLLLQFSRALRALRDAGSNPVGHVANAVMFNARLRPGLRLPDLLRMTRSLGRRLDGDASAAATPGDTERYAWADAAGDAVHVTLVKGRTTAWALQRAPRDEARPVAPPAAPSGAPDAGA
jgi:hypothetical protein